MTEGQLVVTEVEEYEGGSATYEFEFDTDTRDYMVRLGIEFTFHCAAYGWDIQEALDSLKKEVPEDES